MKRFVLLVLLSLFTMPLVFAQDGPLSESQKLGSQIAAFYQAGKFAEAIPLAEKVVEIEKKDSKTAEPYAISLLNLAMLHKERAKQLKYQIGTLPGDDLSKTYKTIDNDIKTAEELMRDSLKVYAGLSLNESLPVASLKYELAWILSNQQTFVIMPQNIRAKIDEAEKLYTEALAVQEKAAGNESDTALRTVLALGDFYTRWINFEKALPFYERYISAYEKNAGVTSRALVPALRGVAEIMVVTDRPAMAQELIKRVNLLTGRQEALMSPKPNLALRAKKIEKVSSAKFLPPEKANDFSYIFSYSTGAGLISPMGSFRTMSVLVNILVDEKGDVVEATVEKDIKDKSVIEKAAMQSKFRPFSYKGETQKMRGTILYVYVD